MLRKTSFQQFESLCEQYQRVVVTQEILGDRYTPVNVFQALAKGHSQAILLDTSDYSRASQVDAGVFIGLDPIASFRSNGDQVTLTEGDKTQTVTAEPFQALRDFYQCYQCLTVQPLAKFAGGMVGLLAHDAVRLIEDIPDQHRNSDEIPDLQFTCYGTHIIFDRRTGKILLAKVVNVQGDKKQAYMDAIQQLSQLINKIELSNQPTAEVFNSSSYPQASVSIDSDDQVYREMVDKAKDYIRQGDAFQIVPSRRFQRPYRGDDFNIYRALKAFNPSPYMYYIRYPDYSVVGASPEKLVSLQNDIVEITPIAGSRPRGQTPEQDIELANELLNDGKELAEHMMLVDLGRNDVGSVCEPGSVHVVNCKTIKKFSRIMHMSATVQGKLRAGCDVFDVLKAGFPAGTLTGAPKIRAMQIIDEIEKSRRGLYGGAVCAIDNRGQLDSCILIRTALVKDGVATVRAGGGVVLDSDPQTEAEETRHKSRAVLEALAFAEGEC